MNEPYQARIPKQIAEQLKQEARRLSYERKTDITYLDLLKNEIAALNVTSAVIPNVNTIKEKTPVKNEPDDIILNVPVRDFSPSDDIDLNLTVANLFTPVKHSELKPLQKEKPLRKTNNSLPKGDLDQIYASFKLNLGQNLDKMLAVVTGQYHCPKFPNESPSITRPIGSGQGKKWKDIWKPEIKFTDFDPYDKNEVDDAESRKHYQLTPEQIKTARRLLQKRKKTSRHVKKDKRGNIATGIKIKKS